MTSTDLRNLPAVHDIVEQLRQLLPDLPQSRLRTAARHAIDTTRSLILSGKSVENSHDAIVRLAVRELHSQIRPEALVNATGVLLHTNLGRAPLSQRARDAMLEASQACDVEYDLAEGARASRNRLLAQSLGQLTGTDSGFIVNNCAAALVLALAGLGGRSTAIARSQIIEIGGGFRLPDIMRASGVALFEVGTTNRVKLQDFADALDNGADAILWMHRSNFDITGFVEEPDLKELRKLATERQVPLIYDLGTGAAWDMTQFGLNAEPQIHDMLVQLADVTLFSGDKLFGGPQAGVLVGKSRAIETLGKHPLARALRADKVTLAAFGATLEAHLNGNLAELPIHQMLAADESMLRQRAENIVTLVGHPALSVIDVVDTVGGGTMPTSQLKGIGVRIGAHSPETLHSQLRSATTPIVGRIQDEAYQLHMRTIPESQIETVAEALRNVLAPVS